MNFPFPQSCALSNLLVMKASVGRRAQTHFLYHRQFSYPSPFLIPFYRSVLEMQCLETLNFCYWMSRRQAWILLQDASCGKKQALLAPLIPEMLFIY